VRAAELADQDARERLALPLVAAFVDVDREAPRRSRLVVVVADGERSIEAGEVDLARVAALDRPREDGEADAVGRATAGTASDPPARADRLAVAGLEVVARDLPRKQGIAFQREAGTMIHA